MGVKRCGRRGCDAVMCDSYVEGQYICRDCKATFSGRIGDQVLSLAELRMRFRKFMDSEKHGSDENRQVTVAEFFALGGEDA